MSDLRVREIGEFDLIDRLIAALPAEARNARVLTLAAGDDAAVALVSAGQSIVVTADTLNEGIHFRTDWTSWGDLGHKAIAVNLSDLAAMGARPLLATVSLSLTGEERVSDLETMYAGLGRCAAASGCVVAGGDITRTPGPLSIAITAIGETIEGRLLRRDAAQVGDLIWVTGTIGAAAAGLALQHLPDSDPRRQATTAPVLIQALHRPIPRTTAGQALASVGVRCGMDLSDGLSGDLRKILVSS
ncbi:MAG: thiamine-phosphate kinase, partial [Chloroflexota bacterium]|nr:thiamine-phosphate kinase [Chloroflexota bacterium]